MELKDGYKLSLGSDSAHLLSPDGEPVAVFGPGGRWEDIERAAIEHARPNVRCDIAAGRFLVVEVTDGGGAWVVDKKATWEKAEERARELDELFGPFGGREHKVKEMAAAKVGV